MALKIVEKHSWKSVVARFVRKLDVVSCFDCLNQFAFHMIINAVLNKNLKRQLDAIGPPWAEPPSIRTRGGPISKRRAPVTQITATLDVQ